MEACWLRGCRYETIEEMKEAVTKVIDTLTQEDFQWAFEKLLEWCNKCIAAGEDYFEGDERFMCVLSIKVPRQKMSGNLLYAPLIYIYIYIYICVCEVHTISFQTFFVWALLLIVHIWNSSPLRSNILWLQCTCCTIPTASGGPHESPLV